MWLQRYVDPDLRLTQEERLSESAVYACIRQIVDPLAAANWDVAVREKDQRTSLGDGDLWYKLNVRPNDDQPASAIKEALVTSAIMSGSGYWGINRDGAGKLSELWPLEYDRVTLLRPDGGDLFYQYRQPGGDETYLRGSDVVHVRAPTISGLNGDSLVDRASPSISLAVAQARFASSFFQNAGVISGYLKFKTAITDPKVRERLKEEWSSKHGGRKAHGTGVLEGDGEYVSTSTDAEKSQLRESREMSVQDISRVFGVPLVLLSLAISAQGYGTNTTQFFEMFVRTCLSSWRRRIQEEVTYKLCPQRSPWPEVSIDLNWLTRGNEKERAETRAILIDSAQLTPNEARADEGRDSKPNGDVLMLKGKPLEQVINPPTPAPAAVVPAKPEPPDPADEEEVDGETVALLRAGVALALENHRRRWVARVRDVGEEKTAEAREELRAKLSADLAAFSEHITGGQFAALAAQAEAGADPSKTVEQLIGVAA
jgi:HK97 family phage portal protein